MDRPRRPRAHTLVEWLRWLVLVAAVAMIVVFLVAQGQRSDVRYGQSPAPARSHRAPRANCPA